VKIERSKFLTSENEIAEIKNGTNDYQSGNFGFGYETTVSGSIKFGQDASTPVAVWKISYEGTGKLINRTSDEGMANFSYSCRSNDENLFWCNSKTSETFSGTIP